MSEIIGFDMEPMLDMYLFESKQLLEQLEILILDIEDKSIMSKKAVDEIFRIMHTLKGSAAMMMVNSIRDVAHSLEDLFSIIRNKPEIEYDLRNLIDIILDSTDMMREVILKMELGNRNEVEYEQIRMRIIKVKDNLFPEENLHVDSADSCSDQLDSSGLNKNQKFYITSQKENKLIKNSYKCDILFSKGCEMENVRAFSIVHNLTNVASDIYHLPENLIEDPNCSTEIARNGFVVYFSSELTEDQVREVINESVFVESISLKSNYDYTEEIKSLNKIDVKVEIDNKNDNSQNQADENQKGVKTQNLITVSLDKLDSLMNLVGEIVITESMVTQSPDLKGLELDLFYKSARQLRKLTDELQDIVMDIRMVPITGLFQKMKRIVRDMSKKLEKNVDFITEGEDTEIDKSILDMISDPMMHLIRNAMDHGIETINERRESGKNEAGSLTLSARNMGSEVVITIKDDGKGIDRNKVLNKAIENGIITKSDEELSDKEVNLLILHPGFSTKDNVTEFSGRGVGMDVVKKNLEKIGGNIGIESELYCGTTIEMRIPLTLAIIDGMEVSVGNSRYTIPTTSIKESFRPEARNVIVDPEGNEMILIRGECFPVIRMHRFFKTKSAVEDLTEGIVVIVESEDREFCLFADELIGEQQVVVKPLPSYIYRFIGELKGISGCTILGNGDMSLIVDVGGF